LQQSLGDSAVLSSARSACPCWSWRHCCWPSCCCPQSAVPCRFTGWGNDTRIAFPTIRRSGGPEYDGLVASGGRARRGSRAAPRRTRGFHGPL